MQDTIIYKVNFMVHFYGNQQTPCATSLISSFYVKLVSISSLQQTANDLNKKLAMAK